MNEEGSTNLLRRKSINSISTENRTLSLPGIFSPKVLLIKKSIQLNELAGRLALLLHARTCNLIPFDSKISVNELNDNNNSNIKCNKKNCSLAKAVLDHCQECTNQKGSCHKSCIQTKMLLRHFRICKSQGFRRQCPICDIVRKDHQSVFKDILFQSNNKMIELKEHTLNTNLPSLSSSIPNHLLSRQKGIKRANSLYERNTKKTFSSMETIKETLKEFSQPLSECANDFKK